MNGMIRFGNGTLVSGMGQRGEINLRGPQRTLLSPLPKDGWDLDMFKLISSRGGRTHFLAQEGKA